jgi:chromate transporter
MNSENRPAPRSLRDLFTFFLLLALQGFGGIIAFIEQGLVHQKKWLTREEFLDDWAVARTMPGPPVVNMSIIFGSRHFGFWGAVVSVLGIFLVPSVIVLTLAMLYSKFGNQPQVVDALRGMGAVAAGLILATGIKLLTALKSNVMGVYFCAAIVITSFVTISIFHWRVIYVMLALGLIGSLYAFYCLKNRKSS